MALSTSRMLVVRGRPPGFAGGMSGSSMAHSASVKSLVYRFRFIPPGYPLHQVFQMASQHDVVCGYQSGGCQQSQPGQVHPGLPGNNRPAADRPFILELWFLVQVKASLRQSPSCCIDILPVDLEPNEYPVEIPAGHRC